MHPSARDGYIKLFKDRAVKFGDFTLASGQKSSYYMDARQMMQGTCLRMLGGFLQKQMAEEIDIDGIGGLETGAICMVTAALMSYPPGIEGFYVRKEAKKHGTGSLIEGKLYPESKVMIVDDVLTTGESAMKAIKAVEAVGAKVVLVSCIVDRLQGAAQLLQEYNFKPLFTIRDFGING